MQAFIGALSVIGNLLPLLSMLPVFGLILRPIVNHLSLVVVLVAVAVQLVYVAQSVPHCSNVLRDIDAMASGDIPKTGEWSAAAQFREHMLPCVTNTLVVACARAFAAMGRVAMALRGPV
jgi:hypothetical protein